ncbi:TPA: hypothetical protein MEE63_001559 [Klebsiella aerogenes]|nr:hypothetical protein [Klebsiella aerogenes]HBW0983956.1 hypothetical protein [Klebsiella aerogenes]
MNISTVNELIQSLESAGELSIKEAKYLELAKAYLDVAAENVALKATSDDRRMFIMNGVQLGYIKVPTVETDPALETIRIAVSPQEPTPATDRIVAEAEARGVEKFAAEQRGVAERLKKRSGDVVTSSVKFCISSAEEAEDFAKQLRERADK